ncbi:hypothetical protein K461DRAFT_265394 [Myriangium duriaei CBS 260.36]|uniref:Glutaredoxin domain-containing protein n=1 Tax=Myriangium duriaei CBS 260.36 TaxID=1168546 RepID=A0A9P4J726_9PEZI|nr:hypothetical protein K461DRAFT_265394 [Myriangium duriaei CBS 260.36]
MSVAAQDLSEWDKDPRLFLFTSLTAGSSQIFTATSRMELILKANKIPFQAIDVATDDKARKLWGRRAGKRKLPGLVKEGFVIGDINEVEEWNEFGELKDAIGPVPGATTTPAAPSAVTTKPTSAPANTASEAAPSSTTAPADDPMRDLAAQAASIGLARQKGPPVLVDASKIKPLEGTGTAEPKPEAAATEAPPAAAQEATPATSTPVASTEPAKLETINAAVDQKQSSIDTATAAAAPHIPRDPSDGVPSAPEPSKPVATAEQRQTTIDTAAAAAYISRDPTDGVPSAGTPITANTPGISYDVTPVPASAAESSDSLAGGAGLAESGRDSIAAESSTSLSGVAGADLDKTASSSSTSSLPSRSASTRHRGSDVRLASKEEIQEIEDGQRIDEGDETEEAEEKAADASKAGESVKD